MFLLVFMTWGITLVHAQECSSEVRDSDTGPWFLPGHHALLVSAVLCDTVRH